MKAIYRHKQSGDIFAIETDEDGHVLSAGSPLLNDDLAPKFMEDPCLS